MYRWTVVQHELIPELEQRCGVMTPKLERLIHVLDWVRIEEFIISPYGATGRPRHERSWLANAFVAKAVLNLPNTAALYCCPSACDCYVIFQLAGCAALFSLTTL